MRARPASGPRARPWLTSTPAPTAAVAVKAMFTRSSRTPSQRVTAQKATWQRRWASSAFFRGQDSRSWVEQGIATPKLGRLAATATGAEELPLQVRLQPQHPEVRPRRFSAEAG